MKTFKLKMLNVQPDNLEQKQIKLLDGLIINKEDDCNPDQWLIEAFVSKDYTTYFEEVKNINELMIKVKISKIDNEPVLFKSRIIGINDIGENINVLFKGNMEKKK
ncbi:YwpF family protein [Oceanobacillus sp. Castelsardo]|uniref:YwpF family protein n=1 Tax=Oceanobacillus sp. Castelsardo TaxID=1851204 RepID=UPI0008396158|nr:YwpF family protein [Oceanobacillus sp. Castelsardo]